MIKIVENQAFMSRFRYKQTYSLRQLLREGEVTCDTLTLCNHLQ
jgi:hypothetical protein